MIFENSDWLLSKIYPSLTWRIRTTEKELYLTFDDGPVPGITDTVLDILQDYNVKGTFFCVGENIYKNPQTFARLIDSGHRIGNHTYNHLNGWRVSDYDYVKNIEKCNNLIQNVIGRTNNLFRPPYGKIKRTQIKHLKKDYKLVMWSLLTRDYDVSFDKEKCLTTSLRNTSPGAIVVFHDNIKAMKNLIYVLPAYIEHFSSLGFQFKTL